MEIIPIHISKEIELGDDLSKLIIDNVKIQNNDILVVAQKIISKQEGRIIQLSSIKPSLLAQGISSEYKKNPQIVELILSESKTVKMPSPLKSSHFVLSGFRIVPAILVLLNAFI